MKKSLEILQHDVLVAAGHPKLEPITSAGFGIAPVDPLANLRAAYAREQMGGPRMDASPQWLDSVAALMRRGWTQEQILAELGRD